MLDLAAYVLTAGIAVNIGGNNAAAAMAPVYGSGVRTKVQAVALAALFMFLGAVLIGGNVIRTLGQDIYTKPVPCARLLLTVVPLIVLGVMIVANAARVPVATTHVVTSALFGLGLFYGVLNLGRALTILAWWVATAVGTLALGWILGRTLLRYIKSRINVLRPGTRRVTGLLLTLTSAYLAFSIGANNSATSASFLVGAGLMELEVSRYFAGLFITLGALGLGGHLIETVGKRITTLCQVRAILIGLQTATVLLVASLLGIPVSLNTTVTSAVIGMSLAVDGTCHVYGHPVVRRIAITWAVTPVVSAGFAYGLVRFAFA